MIFSKVQLGEYEDKIKKFIFENSKLCSLVDVVQAEYDSRNIPLMDPYPTRFDGIKYWWLGINKFEVYIKTDKRCAPNGLKGASLLNRPTTFAVSRSWLNSKQRAVMRNLAGKVEDRYGPLWRP